MYKKKIKNLNSKLWLAVLVCNSMLMVLLARMPKGIGLALLLWFAELWIFKQVLNKNGE